MGKARKRLRSTATALGFLAPSIAGFLVFTLGPIVAALLLSFYHYDNITPARFAGLDNYRHLLGFHHGPGGGIVANDPNFWSSLGNTVILMFSLPFVMAGAFFLAVLLNRDIPGRIFLRALYYLPSISPLIAVAMVWTWMFNPQGVINRPLIWAFGWMGLSGPNWLGSTAWAKPAFILMEIWAGVGGFTMLLYLAALQGIPRNLYEAAEIDGASAWQRLWHITWPMLGPVHLFILIMGTISGFQAFGWQYVMTEGGPAGSTVTVAYYIFNNAFAYSKMGYAAAVAWILFLIILGLTLLQWRFRGKFSAHYE